MRGLLSVVSRIDTILQPVNVFKEQDARQSDIHVQFSRILIEFL